MGFGSKISIDLTLFTGDAEINPVIYSSGVFNKYYLANKVFIVLIMIKTKYLLCISLLMQKKCFLYG